VPGYDGVVSEMPVYLVSEANSHPNQQRIGQYYYLHLPQHRVFRVPSAGATRDHQYGRIHRLRHNKAPDREAYQHLRPRTDVRSDPLLLHLILHSHGSLAVLSCLRHRCHLPQRRAVGHRSSEQSVIAPTIITTSTPSVSPTLPFPTTNLFDIPFAHP
jgi:hypothetical protein